MINIQFKLKDIEQQRPTSIRAIFYHSGTRFVYSLGEDKTILPILWNSVSQRPINVKSPEEKAKIKRLKTSNPTIETDLSNIETKIENVAREIKSYLQNVELQNKSLEFEQLKIHLKMVFSRSSIKSATIDKKLTLNDYIQTYVGDASSGKRTYLSKSGDRREYAKSSAKLFKEFKTQFDLFQKEIKRTLDFGDINMNFYKSYVDYFISKNYTSNSIGKQIKTIKSILTAATEEGINTNLEFKKSAFRILKADVDNIYLTQEEINAILELNLIDTPSLDIARDAFLCGCFTALRFSDYSRIKKENITKKGQDLFIEIFTKKTGTKAIIPISPNLDKILKKYDYSFPKSYEQKANKAIKEIGKMAGIIEKVEKRETKGGKTIISKIPKFEMIKTHTARRTGATLMYLAGISPIDIMKITQHTTESSFLKYIKINKEETALRMKDNSFFN